MKQSRDGLSCTGGAGFIGSELVRQLAARGERVVVIDNLVQRPARKPRRRAVGPTSAASTVDIRDLDAIVPHLRGACGVVYHLACLGVRHSVHSPHREPRGQRDGDAAACSRPAAAAGVPRFVYVSSSEVYGTAKWAPMTEDHPTFPCTVYGGVEAGGRVLHARVSPHLRLSDRRRPSVQHLRPAHHITKATAAK